MRKLLIFLLLVVIFVSGMVLALALYDEVTRVALFGDIASVIVEDRPTRSLGTKNVLEVAVYLIEQDSHKISVMYYYTKSGRFVGGSWINNCVKNQTGRWKCSSGSAFLAEAFVFMRGGRQIKEKVKNFIEKERIKRNAGGLLLGFPLEALSPVD